MFAQSLIAALFAGYPPSGSDDWILPEVAGTVRLIEADFFVLSSMLVKSTAILEDRAIVEFDVSNAMPDSNDVLLQLYVHNRDPLIPTGQLDLSAFAGDGALGTADFFAGSSLASIQTPNLVEVVTATIDVTEAVRNVLAKGDSFLGIRFSTEGPDRYELGDVVGLPPPYLDLQPIPEPTTILLLGVGALLMRRCRTASRR